MVADMFEVPRLRISFGEILVPFVFASKINAGNRDDTSREDRVSAMTSEELYESLTHLRKTWASCSVSADCVCENLSERA